MKSTKEMAEGERGRFLGAEQNYQSLAEKIAPFVERRSFEIYSTAGRWSAGSARGDRTFVTAWASVSSKRA